VPPSINILSTIYPKILTSIKVSMYRFIYTTGKVYTMPRKNKEDDRIYYRKNREKLVKYSREYRTNNLEKVKKSQKKTREKYGEIYRKRRRNRYKEMRLTLVRILGEKCNSCGYNKDIRGLEIDHIVGLKSSYELKNRKNGRVTVYRYYYKHQDEIKRELQILCGTCHRIKTNEIDRLRRY